MAKKTKNDAAFSDDFSELEEIVEWFERDDIDLDEALKKFERGMELSESLRSQLEDAKNKIETIKAKFDAE